MYLHKITYLKCAFPWVPAHAYTHANQIWITPERSLNPLPSPQSKLFQVPELLLNRITHCMLLWSDFFHTVSFFEINLLLSFSGVHFYFLWSDSLLLEYVSLSVFCGWVTTAANEAAVSALKHVFSRKQTCVSIRSVSKSGVFVVGSCVLSGRDNCQPSIQVATPFYVPTNSMWQL